MTDTTEDLRAAALAWLTTPVRCRRGCLDCHGSGCRMTPMEYPELFTPPPDIAEHVYVLLAEEDKKKREQERRQDEEECEEAEIWLNTKIPCEPDCGGGCEGAGCGYTQEDILGSFKVWNIPRFVRQYLAVRGWDEFKDIERVEREREQHEEDIRRSERRERRMEGDRGRYR